jgi:hypothetical protein
MTNRQGAILAKAMRKRVDILVSGPPQSRRSVPRVLAALAPKEAAAGQAEQAPAPRKGFEVQVASLEWP